MDRIKALVARIEERIHSGGIELSEKLALLGVLNELNDVLESLGA